MTSTPGRYQTTCDGCGQQVWVDHENRFVRHPRRPMGVETEQERMSRMRSEQRTLTETLLAILCPASGLMDLNAESDWGVWEVNGGLPTLGKHHR